MKGLFGVNIEKMLSEGYSLFDILRVTRVYLHPELGELVQVFPNLWVSTETGQTYSIDYDMFIEDPDGSFVPVHLPEFLVLPGKRKLKRLAK